MVLKSALGPFRPGPGGMPPYLAGREAEQNLFRALLSDLAGGAPPPSEVILYGPRGNGKTVLLGWIEEEAERFPEVRVRRLTPSEIPDRARLAEELLPDVWWKRFTPEEIAAIGIRWRPGQDGPPSPRAVLSARARKQPFALLLDEAHTLDPEAGRELLNASQVVGRQRPFLLVLAGTPNLEPHLARLSASFWNRAEQVRIGRLDEGATAEALRRPFEEEGISVPEDALAAMVRESQCYPYFVQLLGRAVWEQVSGSASNEVTCARLDAGRPRFEEVRGEYYAHRFEELARRGLLPVGGAVAEAFRGRSVLTWTELDGAIRAGLGDVGDPDAPREALETLRDLGYIWRARGRPEWEPGIPSLMDYMRAFAPATVSTRTGANPSSGNR